MRAGLLDKIEIHLIPVLLCGGVRLLDHLGDFLPLPVRDTLGSYPVSDLYSAGSLTGRRDR